MFLYILYHFLFSNSIKCKNCLADRFAENSNAITCIDCPSGWVAENASSTCFACSAGMYKHGLIPSHCEECEVGRYMESPENNEGCKICPGKQFLLHTMICSYIMVIVYYTVLVYAIYGPIVTYHYHTSVPSYISIISGPGTPSTVQYFCTDLSSLCSLLSSLFFLLTINIV